MYHNIILMHPTKTAGTAVKKALNAKVKGHLFPNSWGQLMDNNIVVVTVRNPYDRVLSMYNHFGFSWVNSFDEFLGLIAKSNNILLASQTKYLVKNMELLKFESLNKDFNKLCKKHNISATLERVNVTHYKRKTSLSLKEKEIIYKLYKTDFEILDYEK
ncbi:hypothetical protein [Tenacibaculum sp. 190524A05c]|uniref:hypothetical protein n=1 Tax=Tenacibaculum platacis TaxID=3137852 RepID=UPI0031FAAD14